MKTTISRGWKWAFGVACVITVFGCLYQPRGTSAETSGDALAAEAAPAPENLAPPGSTNEVAIPEEIPPTPPANLSPGVSELVKLAQSGMGDEVLMAYVNKSGQAFHPTVDEIVYLKDLGVSESVIAAVIAEGNPTANPAETAQQFTNNYPNTVDNSAPAPAPAETNFEANPQVASSEAVTAPLTPQPAGAAPVQQVDVGYFQDALSPYGTWVNLPDYGPCWQPTVVLVNRGWRPYTDRGRWIYTSAGWYWQSDYSWGWAPFHYGRWYCDNRIGWVWVPGATWGPAWVSWRYTDDYCGWAPLPPGARFVGHGFRYHNASVSVSFDFGIRADFYTFVPTGRLCDRTPSRYYVHGSSHTTIYRNSVVINNYVRGNNNTVINEGISKDRVAKASRTPIRTVALRDMPTANNPIGRADRFEGNKLDVFRPNVTRDNSRSRTGNVSTSFRNPGNPLPSTPAVTRQVPTTQTPNRENSIPPTRSTEPRNTTPHVPGTRVETTTPPTTRTPSQTETRRSTPTRPLENQPNSTQRTIPTPTPTPTPTQPSQQPQRTAPTTPQRNFPQRSATPSATDAVRPQGTFNAPQQSPQQNVIRSAPAVPQQTMPRPVERPNNAVPNSLRTLPTERPQTQIAPQQRAVPAPEVNRSFQRSVPQSVPQSIQSVPRQEVQRSQPQVQRSQPAQSSRGDGRDGRDRNR